VLGALFWWITTTLASYVYGCALETGRRTYTDEASDRILKRIFLGLLLLQTLLLGFSLFAPLGAVAAVIVLFAIPICLAILPTVRRRLFIPGLLSRPRTLGAAVVLMAIAAWNNTGMVEMQDTGVYHYQMVRWLHEHGTVKGVAAFAAAFGFSSGWFAIPAAMEVGVFEYRTAALTGGLILLLAISHFALALARVLHGNARSNDWFAAGSYPLIFWNCLLARYQLSPSPNLAVWVFSVFFGWMLLEEPDPPLLVFSAAGGTVVKIVAVPLLAVAVVFAGRRSNRRTLLVGAVVGGAVIAPLLSANLVSSGCPFYPSPWMCLNQPGSIGPRHAEKIQNLLQVWTRWRSDAPAVANRRSASWILHWLVDPADIAILVLLLACVFATCKLKAWDIPNAKWVLAAAVGGLVFLGFTMPDPRYGIGYLAMFPGLLFAAIGRRYSVARVGFDWTPLLLYAAALVLLIDAGGREATYWRRTPGAERQVLTERLLLPPRIYGWSRPNRTTAVKLNNFVYQSPAANELCWGAPLPCAPIQPSRDAFISDPALGLPGGFQLRRR
jgi:hypothetical protein